MRRIKQDGVYFFWSASIIVCMLLSIFAVGFASFARASSGAASSASGGTASAKASAKTSDGPTVLGESADMGQDYVDKFVFLGDSTTYGLGFYKIVSSGQVWTPESGTLTLSLWSAATIVYEDGSQIPINDAVAKKQPAYMLITLGVNGISFMSQDYFIKEYTSLVQTVQQTSPDTKIILNSIYPISASYRSNKSASGGAAETAASAEETITNDKIDAANKWVQSIAKSTGVKYLDSESVLKDSKGALNDSYQNGDGLHLNPTGYQQVITYLRTHGYQ